MISAAPRGVDQRQLQVWADLSRRRVCRVARVYLPEDLVFGSTTSAAT